MGPYIVLIFLILGIMGAWKIGGDLSNINKTKKDPHKPSQFEKKLAASARRHREEAERSREELKQLREKIKREKEERELQKEKANRK